MTDRMPEDEQAAGADKSCKGGQEASCVRRAEDGVDGGGVADEYAAGEAGSRSDGRTDPPDLTATSAGCQPERHHDGEQQAHYGPCHRVHQTASARSSRMRALEIISGARS